MNALDKTKNVRKALECCKYGEKYRLVCNECPYDNNGCKLALYNDALEVIDGFKAELRKRIFNSSSSATKPMFITLSVFTNGEKDEKIAIKVDDIWRISDTTNSLGKGSIISVKPAGGEYGLTFFVKDTFEDILEKISNGE